MTLTACKDCKAQISKDADKCPQCGARQHMSRWKILVIGLIAIPVIGGVFDGFGGKTKPQTVETSKPTPVESCSQTMDARVATADKAAIAKDAAGIVQAYKGCESNIPAGPKRETYAKAIVEVVKAEKAAKKREGVRLGMTEQDVLDSSWGKPQRVNQTTNSRDRKSVV